MKKIDSRRKAKIKARKENIERKREMKKMLSSTEYFIMFPREKRRRKY